MTSQRAKGGEKKFQRKSIEKFKKNSSCRWGGCHAICVPVQMKNLDSPTLNSTLFKDIDTCRAAVREQKRERGRAENGLVIASETTKHKEVSHLLTG